MAGIIRAARRRASGRRPSALPSLRVATPILVESISSDGTTLTITFDQPVSLQGVPAYSVEGEAVTPTSAAKTADDTVTVTFSGGFMGTVLDVGVRDPAIRNASGGYVTSRHVNIA